MLILCHIAHLNEHLQISWGRGCFQPINWVLTQLSNHSHTYLLVAHALLTSVIFSQLSTFQCYLASWLSCQEWNC